MSTNDYALLEEIRDIFRYRHAQDDGLRLPLVEVPEDPYDSDELPSE